RVEDWDSAVGVDRGVVIALATSEGDQIDRDMWRPKEGEHLRRLEQARERKKLARAAKNTEITKENQERKKKGLDPLPPLSKSRNEERNDAAIAGLHARARRRRKDFSEQTSTDLARNHRLSVFEDLHVAAMTASAKGTIEAPGKKVAQKAGLNRAILDKGWGAIEHRTGEKAPRHGHLSVVVPARNTSITCPKPGCGFVDKANRVTRSMFVCQACGYAAHADTNAAIEVRERGIKLALAGGTPVAAHLGTNQGPDSSGAEPELWGRPGSGNQETDTSADQGAA
ncbi:MAG: RNA-guided endonuclease InsQ/TnpB family protein, partial [Acidimicrobiales bacterium]